MDGELAYWQAKSGLASPVSMPTARLSYLTAQNGGVKDSTSSLFAKLYGNELTYWRQVSGLSAASLADAKYAAINNAINGGYGVAGYGLTGYGV